MATFQVPQFIEQKPKIIGPFTLGQFFYLAGAGAVSFIAFYIFNFFFWLFITMIVGSVGIAMAFVKINGQELPQVVSAAIAHFSRPKTYTWQRQITQKTLDIGELEELEELRKNMSFQEKLKSVALNIATGKIFSPKKFREEQKERYETVTYLTGERAKAKKVDYPTK